MRVRVKFRNRRTRNRMWGDDETIAIGAQNARHEIPGADKLRGQDADCRQSQPFADDRVVQTARRTTASIADTRDQRIPALGIAEQ